MIFVKEKKSKIKHIKGYLNEKESLQKKRIECKGSFSIPDLHPFKLRTHSIIEFR